ncbi:MAG: F0F1 ATP synthase subunit alpha [Candidatus Pacebacteria bacterium]|nr:F0F1 ATP synthase subunit alpha [Candidatus Paceibacterota bacterium]MCD8508267.1 F0F1 ATP synthase subunit alpha [Candidatus Paceibacterota bacterium]MCD8527743.1 F0F1 ATP synthase subunit alpha [Candidatus Paceibacterota bacterium]MCD8563493.1 F0F1 ATP synthase subunit alpha [Candidatus Paceibacterota bacterium]
MSIDTVIKNLENKIKNFESSTEATEFGTVISVSDGIARIAGMSGCQSSEMLDFGNGVMGLALNLEADSIGAIILGDYTHIKEGDEVKRTQKILSVPVSDDVMGRVVNPLVQPVDDLGDIRADEMRPIEKIAPGVMSRQPVDEPMQTGIKAIDALVPVGRGQRELIIGDRQTGKTTVAIDTIINQKGQNMKCVYVAIGQKKSKVMRVMQQLKEAGALEYTTIVLAGASDPASLSYLAPYTGVTIAEYFMDKGQDVLIVYDDLSKHAVAYREISLLLRRPPGREAYPGDVFYLHSRLLERAARRNQEHGGGSITALPIIETQAGDLSAYIPTNVISITDGQIFLESNLFYKGVRPAINVGNSVSRVGGSAQGKAMKKNAGPMKLALAQFRELESFAQFGSDLDESTKQQIERGRRVVEVLKQNQYQPVPTAQQVAILYAVNKGFLDAVALEKISSWESGLYAFLKSGHADLLGRIEKGWDEDIENTLKQAIADYSQTVA